MGTWERSKNKKVLPMRLPNKKQHKIWRVLTNRSNNNLLVLQKSRLSRIRQKQKQHKNLLRRKSLNCR